MLTANKTVNAALTRGRVVVRDRTDLNDILDKAQLWLFARELNLDFRKLAFDMAAVGSAGHLRWQSRKVYKR